MNLWRLKKKNGFEVHATAARTIKASRTKKQFRLSWNSLISEFLPYILFFALNRAATPMPPPLHRGAQRSVWPMRVRWPSGTPHHQMDLLSFRWSLWWPPVAKLFNSKTSTLFRKPYAPLILNCGTLPSKDRHSFGCILQGCIEGQAQLRIHVLSAMTQAANR